MSAASLPKVAKPSARDRLLASADELFYAEGVHTVGIDRVIEHAGVAKASLYSSFGNKDGLIRAYLESRHQRRRARITNWLERYDNPRDRVLGIFDMLADLAAMPTYRGCPFYNATAESPPGSVTEQVSNEFRAWHRALFTDLSRDAGARDPEALAAQLVILYDGSSVGARMNHSPAAALTARAIAATLLDAATSQPRSTPGRSR
jgi:AcrR family transcriptional regulator